MKLISRSIAALSILAFSSFAIAQDNMTEASPAETSIVSSPSGNLEFSFLSGIFSSQDLEVMNQDGGSQIRFNLGTRAVFKKSNSSAWVVSAFFSITNYEAAEGIADPDGDISFLVSGGYRHIFPQWGSKVSPYMQARLGLDRESSDDGDTENTSLIYGADIGFNIYVSQRFFFLVETPIFSSTLYGKEESADTNGDVETTFIQGQFDLTGSLSTTRIGLGIVF